MPYNYWKRSPEDLSGSVDQSQGFNLRYGERYNDSSPISLEELMKNKYKLYMQYIQKQQDHDKISRRMPLSELVMQGPRGIDNTRQDQHMRQMQIMRNAGYNYTPETEMSPLFYNNSSYKGIR